MSGTADAVPLSSSTPQLPLSSVNNLLRKSELDNLLSDEYTTIAVDQTRKTVGCDLYHSWFPCGERVTFPFWQHSKQGVKLLGAVTDERDLFATEVVDRFTSDVTIRFLRVLQDEFGEKIYVLLDNASYFKSQQVCEFIKET